MNHVSCILRQLDYLALNSRSDRWIEFAQLRTSLRAYFDSVGHETWRGFHALNFPAKSWRRASRSSAMIFGFCDVNQSKSSSRLSTDESTGTGISTVSFGITPAYRFELRKANAVGLSSRSPDRYQPSSYCPAGAPRLLGRRRITGQWSAMSHQPSTLSYRLGSLHELLNHFLKLGAQHVHRSVIIQVSPKRDVEPVSLLSFGDEII